MLVCLLIWKEWTYLLAQMYGILTYGIYRHRERTADRLPEERKGTGGLPVGGGRGLPQLQEGIWSVLVSVLLEWLRNR